MKDDICDTLPQCFYCTTPTTGPDILTERLENINTRRSRKRSIVAKVKTEFSRKLELISFGQTENRDFKFSYFFCTHCVIFWGYICMCVYFHNELKNSFLYLLRKLIIYCYWDSSSASANFVR